MQAAVEPKTIAIQSAAEAFGTRLKPILDLLLTTVDKSSEVESTPSSERTSTQQSRLSSHFGLVDDVEDAISGTDVLRDHISAIAETTVSLAWVISDDPVEHIKTTTDDLKPHLDSLRNKKDPTHSLLADSLEQFVQAVSDYVEDGHSEPLSFVQDSSKDEDQYSATHLKDFRDTVTDAAVSEFKKSSDLLNNSIISKITNLFFNLFGESYKFIVQASKLPAKPSDDNGKNQMLAPIINLITQINAASNDVLPSDAAFNHAKSVEESLSIFSWIIADEKPTSFITEGESASQFYLNKILTSSKSSNDANLQKDYVNNFKNIFVVLRKYIKEHFPTGLRYGIGVEDPQLNGNGIKSLSVDDKDADVDEEDTDNYVTAFKNLIDGPLVEYVKASDSVGGQVAIQAKVFKEAWDAEAQFLAQAINVPKPTDIQPMLLPIGEKMGVISSFAQSAGPRDPLTQHLTAVSESIAALGWVAVDEKATAFVGDSAGTGQFYIDKVKMNAKKTDNPDVHRSWAKSLETLWAGLKAYVKEYHTQKLVWNPPKLQKKKTKSRATVVEDDSDDGDNYVSAFKALIDGPLAAFEKASDKIGGEVSKQAKLFTEAWKTKHDFLNKAYNNAKPDDIQPMLTPIGEKMGAVGSIAQEAGPRAPLTHHLTAVSESIGALGWVAVEEKATGFVGDSAGAGQFYLDKVRMGARQTGDPGAHREWAKSLETLWSDLKAYVKEHHTQKLVWNPPKKAKRTVVIDDDDEDDEDTGNDYVSAFKSLLDGPLVAFEKASDKIGGDVAQQTKLFTEAWKAESEFLNTAFNTPKPDDIQSMLTPIGEKMGAVGSIAQEAGPRAPLTHHLTAVSESIGALGWVAVEEKATGFVGDSAGAGQFYLDKVKMGARQTDDPAAHREWSKCLETLWSDLKAYVKEYHTQKLVWNPPKVAKKKKKSVKTSVEDEDDSSNYVTAFNQIIEGPLANFLKSCNDVGGDVAKQGDIMKDAWKAEAEFLSKAYNTPKPDDYQPMLTPIGEKMGATATITDSAGPRDPLTQHLTAVSESISALGWVAVEEKATGFVGDSAGAGQFYIDKVKMNAKKTDKPEVHREWAKSLETLWVELKAYVKEYHTQKLVWNPIKKTRTISKSVVDDNDDGMSTMDSVSAFKSLVEGTLQSFTKVCKSFGGDLSKQVEIFEKAWTCELELLEKAKGMRKPDTEEFQKMLTPIGEKIGEVTSIAEGASPRNDFFQHLSAISESMGALGWVAVEEKATAFVGESSGAGQFYIDKVKMAARKLSKDDGDKHREWAKLLETLWKELKAYVKEYHTQRLSWSV